MNTVQTSISDGTSITVTCSCGGFSFEVQSGRYSGNAVNREVKRHQLNTLQETKEIIREEFQREEKALLRDLAQYECFYWDCRHPSVAITDFPSKRKTLCQYHVIDVVEKVNFAENFKLDQEFVRKTLQVRLCVTCDNEAKLKVYKTFGNSGSNYYCAEHGRSYTSLPGFRTLIIRSDYVKAHPEPIPQRIEEVGVAKGVVLSSQPHVDSRKTKTSPVSYKVNIAIKWVVTVGLGIAVFALINWVSVNQQHKSALEDLNKRNNLAVTCFSILEEDLAVQSGPVGSASRTNAVKNFYSKVINASCTEWGDGSLFRNPFQNLTDDSPLSLVFQRSILISLQRWNGTEPIVPHCADGWASGSKGKQGACSHHGGVTDGFAKSDHSFYDALLAGERLYPSIAEMKSQLAS